MSLEDKIDLIAAVLAAGVVAGTAKSSLLPASVAGVFRNIRKELLEKGFDVPKKVPANPPEAAGTPPVPSKKPRPSKAGSINQLTGSEMGNWLKPR
jgi:hypothetical protein